MTSHDITWDKVRIMDRGMVKIVKMVKMVKMVKIVKILKTI